MDEVAKAPPASEIAYRKLSRRLSVVEAEIATVKAEYRAAFDSVNRALDDLETALVEFATKAHRHDPVDPEDTIVSLAAAARRDR